MNEKKPILLVVCIPTHFSELIRVARTLKKSGLYKPIILFNNISYTTLMRDSTICNQENILCLNNSGNIITNFDVQSSSEENVDVFPHKLKSIKKKIGLIYKKIPDSIKSNTKSIYSFVLKITYPIYYFIFLFMIFREKFKFSKKILVRESVHAIVLAEDNITYATSIWIKIAHKLGIPSVIVPFTVVNAKEAAEEIYLDPNFNLKKILNLLVGTLKPKWVYTHKRQRLLRLPVIHILTREFMGLSVPNPWIVNSGYADAIAVESRFMLDHYRNEGLPEKQLILTGAIFDDVLALNLKNSVVEKKRLYKELNLSSGKGLLLCALPPNQFPRPECDFETYPKLVEFWVKSLLDQDKYHVILRLHPRVDPDSMQYLEKLGIKICLRDTAELVPLCDIFVASISATIRWAIACGKPVINYDVYRYQYADYFNASGVIGMEEKDDFIHAVKQLTTDKAYYNSLLAHQRKVMDYWGLLDGKASQRILDMFGNLKSEPEKETA